MFVMGGVFAIPRAMCGRVFVKSTFAELLAAFAGVKRDDNLADLESGPRFNGAPSLSCPIIAADKDATSARWIVAKTAISSGAPSRAGNSPMRSPWPTGSPSA